MRRAVMLFFAAANLAAQTPTGTIHGTVKDAATGDPLPHFTISAGTRPFPPRDTTDDHGAYTIANVPCGAVTISAISTSRTSVTREIQLNPGDDLTLNFEIPPNATISGRVLNADNEPQSNVPVWVVQNELTDGLQRHTLLGPQITGRDGSYKFDASLPVGRKFYLVAERNPKQELVTGEPKPLDQRDPIEATTYFGDALTLEGALPLRLAPAEQRSGVDIKIRHAPYYCADGTVDVNGKPASAPIAVYQRSLAATSLRLVHAASGTDGTFRVCGLTPGQYLMSTLANRLWSDEEFSIANSDVHHLRLTVDAASLHLTVVWDGDPSPRNSESMSVHTHVGSPREETTAAPISIQIAGLLNQISMGRTLDGAFDGPFGLQFAAGDYAVNVLTIPSCCYVKELFYNGVRFTDHKLHLAPGASGTLRVVLATHGGNLTCTVPDGATAMLFSADGPPLPIPAPGASWRNLAPGKYHVLALTRPLQLPDESDKLTELLSQAQEVEIEAKLTKQVKLDAVPVK